MDAADVALRNSTYRLLVKFGRVPDRHEVAANVGVSADDVTSGWRRLHDEHALVLDDEGAIRMAHPFSAVPTPYLVDALGRAWYANCAWDALGIPAALHTSGDVRTSCPDCGDDITVAVDGDAVDDPTLFFHCLVPASHWWDDVAFT